MAFLFKGMRVYGKVPKQKCRDMTGREPVKARWADTNTQDEANPNYRSRLLTKDYKTKSDPELYTTTPPIDALRLLLCLAATGYASKGARRRVVINDVARAYLNAPSLSPTFVEICQEDFEEGGEDRCGELRVSMYGARPAVQHWQKCFTELLTKEGFKVARASTCIMRNDEKDIDMSVHGDAFVSIGDESELLWLQKVRESKFEISRVALGPGPDNFKEAKVLNRITTASDTWYTYGAGARHADLIVRILSLQNARALYSPGIGVTQEGGEALHDHERLKQFQSTCARASFLPHIYVGQCAGLRRRTGPDYNEFGDTWSASRASSTSATSRTR